MSWADRLRLTAMDEESQTAVSLLYIADPVTDPQALALSSAMFELSEAHPALSTREKAVLGPSIAPGGGGAYATNRDMVTLQFMTVLGAAVSITQSAPKENIFQGDMKTVNPLNADVADAINNILAFSTDNAGNAIAEYRRGWRWHLDE